MGPLSGNKLKFFSYSSYLLYNPYQNLGIINNTALPFYSKIIFNWKKLVRTLFLIILAIVIKSMCQYFFGAEETSLDKILLILDYPYYIGCLFGSIIMVFIQDNWNIMWDYFPKSITMKFDSGDESSGDEAIKKSWKGKDKLTDSNSNITSKAVDKGKNPDEVLEKGLPSDSSSEIAWVKFEGVDKLSIKEQVLSSLTAKELREDTEAACTVMSKITKQSSDYTTINLDKINANDVTHVDTFFTAFLQQHATLFSHYLNTRDTWIQCRVINVDPEVRTKVWECINNKTKAREKYISTIKDLSRHKSSITQAKVFFGAFNEHKNIINKELNKAEELIIKDLKKGPFCLVDHPDCKNLVKSLKDYAKAKEAFNSQDNYLKKKIGEIINRK